MCKNDQLRFSPFLPGFRILWGSGGPNAEEAVWSAKES